MNWISNREGILYDQTILHMKKAEATIFAFNETHRDEINAQNNSLLTKSKNRIFNHKDYLYYQTVTSPSQAPVTSFARSRGKMMGIQDPLVGHMQQRV